MARARRARRTYKAAVADRISGVLAKFDQPCARCDDGILVNQRIVAAPGGGFMHVHHAAGQDDDS